MDTSDSQSDFEILREGPAVITEALNGSDFDKSGSIVEQSTVEAGSAQLESILSWSDIPIESFDTTIALEDVTYHTPEGNTFVHTTNGQQFTFGSPGHTPFPVQSKEGAQNARIYFQGDYSYELSSSGSMDPPPVPFNTPDDFELIEVLKGEASKHEKEIKERLHENKMLETFKTPVRKNLAKPRRKLRNTSSTATSSGLATSSTPVDATIAVEELLLKSKAERITEYRVPASVNEKEVQRRKRINLAVDMLRKIIPGVDEATEKTDVYELTAKYILFLKKKVGSKYDRDFLMEYLTY